MSPIGGDIVFSDLSVNISELELSEMNKLRRTKGETLWQAEWRLIVTHIWGMWYPDVSSAKNC